MDTFDTDPSGQAGQVAAPMPQPPAGGDASRKLVIGGLVVIAIIAIAAVAFATMNAGRSNDGAEDPKAAMQKFFDGLSAEDMVATVDAFLPSEADPVIDYAGLIGTELIRIEMLKKGVNVQSLDGIELEFTDMTYRTEQIADGFVRVYVTDGDALFDVDPAELPLGRLILDNLTPEMRAEFDTDPPPQSDSMAGEDFYMVAVEEDDGWYLSLWYTLMDAIFTEAGYGTPAFGEGITPVGAERPGAAVEAAFRKLLSLDLEGLVGMLPPDEMRALYDYMPLVMDDYNETVGAFGSFVTINLTSFGTSEPVKTDSGATRVKVQSFELEFASFFLELDGTISFDGECFEVSINDQGGNLSDLGDVPDRINSCDPGIADSLTGGISPVETPDFLSDLGAAEVGILVVEEDGRWYVSPTETLGDGMLQGLKIWDAATLQQYIDWALEVGMDTAASF